ncbi:hypothetical protein LCGC14_0640770 [marine sediment metagenome]|uniref:histidine kinase n=1 Tax=marine sediment metagenome TaxID=412755 RepID=A0A0F9RIN0_9ZZZZ
MSGSVVEIKIDYADLFEYSLDFLFILDLKGNIIDINNVATETLGYSRREILNMNITEFLLEEEIEQLLNKRKELINIGRISQYHVYSIRKKNGELLYLETHGIPLREEGEIHSILGIGHEITEMKNAERLLKTSEIKYRSLFNQSPYSIFIFDNKGNLQDSNRNLINKLAEYADEDFTGKNFIEIIKYFKNSKQLLQLFSERFKALREGDILDSIEFPLITKKGMKIWLYWESSIMRINGDKFIQVIIQDITEKKESEEKFHVLFNNSTRGIAYHRVIYDLQNNPVDYVITDVNTQFEAIVPLKREEVINKRATEVYQVENAPYLNIYSKVAASQESTEFEAFVPPMNAYFKISVISPKKGEFITVFDDITSQKESEQKLKESEEKFRTLFEKANDGILLSDAETWRIFTGNQKICQMLGYSLEEIKNFSLVDLHPKETLHSIDDQFVHKEQEDLSMANDVPMKKKDGSVFYCNVNSSEIELAGRKYIMGIFRDISHRRQAEQKLKESEEKFRTIAEQSLLGIIIIQDGVFKYVNDVVSEIIGYDIQDILNWSQNEFFNKIHPSDVPIALKRFQQMQLGEMDAFLSYPYRIYTKSNKVKWIDVYSKIITFQGKNAILASIADVTEKKEAEQKLQESEEKYRWISENTDDLIVVYDEELNVEYSNEETHVRTLGYPIHKLNDLDFRTSLIHRDDLKQTGEAFREGFQKGKFKHQIRIKHKDRQYLWFETKGRVLIDRNERRKLLAVSRDITEIKKAEEKLRESEEKFRTIAEQSFMGIIIVQEGKLKYLNKALAKMLEYPFEEMIKWSDKEMAEIVHPDDLEYIQKRLQSNREGTMSQISQNYFRIITKSGEIRWLEDYTSKIIYQGKVANLMSIVDVSNKKEAERLIIEENERLLELNELRKDLITRVSHELKTPMTSIYGSIQILLTIYNKDLSEEVLNYVKIGHRGCLRLKQLIENLLDASRLESKKFELSLLKENLVEIIVDCVEDLNYLVHNRHLLITLDLPDEIQADIDSLRFRQVITNIISNAIKNTPKEGEIFIHIIEDADKIDILIRDTGVGLTKQEQEKLFGKFGKIERYGMDLDVDIEGCGLGLYISKEIIELHKGQILVESEGRNKGSTFTIRLFK